MHSSLSQVALALAGAWLLSGCHARWFPLATPPTYYFRTQSTDAELDQPIEGVVTDDGASYADGFKYALPAPGSLQLTARPASAAVQLDIDVFADGNVPIATTKDQADKKLTVQDLQQGDLYVVVHEGWKEAQDTRFKLLAIYNPADPDGANGAYKTQAGARDLPADKGLVSDTVDYSAMRRTNFWKITLPGDGGLAVKFSKEDDASHLTAEFVSPSGAPQKIDPVVGLKNDDLQAGDYYVKVSADAAGDSGKYTLATTFKSGDACKNGGPACTVDGAEELKLPSDSKTGEVDFSEAKEAHYYKLSVKEKGKLSLNFKVLHPARGSGVSAYLMQSPGDDGEKIAGRPFLKPLDVGDYYLRVTAPAAGDGGKYGLEAIFQPDNFIGAEVVEIGHTPCMLTVSAGTNQNVHAGAAATVVGANNVALDTAVVDEAFPNLSTVRPTSQRTCGALPASGAKVEIAGQ